jgi:hypothetical protein
MKAKTGRAVVGPTVSDKSDLPPDTIKWTIKSFEATGACAFPAFIGVLLTRMFAVAMSAGLLFYFGPSAAGQLVALLGRVL